MCFHLPLLLCHLINSRSHTDLASPQPECYSLHSCSSVSSSSYWVCFPVWCQEHELPALWKDSSEICSISLVSKQKWILTTVVFGSPVHDRRSSTYRYSKTWSFIYGKIRPSSPPLLLFPNISPDTGDEKQSKLTNS